MGRGRGSGIGWRGSGLSAAADDAARASWMNSARQPNSSVPRAFCASATTSSKS
jgi:hypothetical protein